MCFDVVACKVAKSVGVVSVIEDLPGFIKLFPCKFA